MVLCRFVSDVTSAVEGQQLISKTNWLFNQARDERLLIFYRERVPDCQNSLVGWNSLVG